MVNEAASETASPAASERFRSRLGDTRRAGTLAKWRTCSYPLLVANFMCTILGIPVLALVIHCLRDKILHETFSLAFVVITLIALSLILIFAIIGIIVSVKKSRTLTLVHIACVVLFLGLFTFTVVMSSKLVGAFHQADFATDDGFTAFTEKVVNTAANNGESEMTILRRIYEAYERVYQNANCHGGGYNADRNKRWTKLYCEDRSVERFFSELHQFNRIIPHLTNINSASAIPEALPWEKCMTANGFSRADFTERVPSLWCRINADLFVIISHYATMVFWCSVAAISMVFLTLGISTAMFIADNKNDENEENFNLVGANDSVVRVARNTGGRNSRRFVQSNEDLEGTVPSPSNSASTEVGEESILLENKQS